MKQQTAVEWFADKFFTNIYEGKAMAKSDIAELLEQAKQMEIERIKKAFSDGQETPLNHPTLPHYSSEEYYNETFKNQ